MITRVFGVAICAFFFGDYCGRGSRSYIAATPPLNRPLMRGVLFVFFAGCVFQLSDLVFRRPTELPAFIRSHASTLDPLRRIALTALLVSIGIQLGSFAAGFSMASMPRADRRPKPLMVMFICSCLLSGVLYAIVGVK
jgi:hypothetical protein